MSALKHLGDDLLLEDGKIAALRGSIRDSLLMSIGALLSSGLHDQGFGRLLVRHTELQEICDALVTVSRVRGISEATLQQLTETASTYREDFVMASAIANGTWTMLGGHPQPWYGLFEGEVATKGSLEPKWKKIALDDLRRLFDRLNGASENLEKLTIIIQGTMAERRTTKAHGDSV